LTKAVMQRIKKLGSAWTENKPKLNAGSTIIFAAGS
jgi:hypothetical protein